jgi:hypothetical protein
LSQLSDARHHSKSAGKSLAFNWPIACNARLRDAIQCFASMLFALNEVPRDPRFWPDQFEKLKRMPKGFRQIYKNVMTRQSRKETEKYVKELLQIRKNIEEFCKPEVIRIVRKLGGVGKVKKKLKLSSLYADVLQSLMS